jgi:hypothetical protein
MGSCVVHADAAEYPTTVDLLPAADVVMSGFSTTNYFAILLGLRDVVYAGENPRLSLSQTHSVPHHGGPAAGGGRGHERLQHHQLLRHPARAARRGVRG